MSWPVVSERSEGNMNILLIIIFDKKLSVFASIASSSQFLTSLSLSGF